MSSALTSNCVVPFSLIKRNDIGIAYANVILMNGTGAKYIPQYINVGSSINFNQFTKLSSIAWLTANTLTFLKNGSYRIQFFMNYISLYGNVQISLYVNGLPLTSTYGNTSSLAINGGQINGEFTVKLNIGDQIQLINTSGSFILSPTGSNNQVLAGLTVTEISDP